MTLENNGEPRSRRGALAGLSLSMLLSSLGTSIANVGLPTLVDAFGTDFQAVQWVVLAYLLAMTAAIVGAGRLGDLVGRRRLLLGGLGVFTAASAACGWAPSLGGLIAARAVQGIGAAAMMALTMAFVGETVPKAQTGRAMGLLGTMSAVGTALGPSLGGLLIAMAGWRAIFLINVPLGVAAWLFVRHALPGEQGGKRAGGVAFDAVGTTLLAVALVAYALAATLGRGRFGASHAGLLAVAAAAAGLFVFVERRLSAPLVRLEWLRDRVIGSGLVTSALVATVMMTTLVVGPFHLSRALGLGAAAVGAVLAIGPVAAALAGVPAGRLVDRFGADGVTLAGLTGIGGGAVVLAAMPASWGVGGYVGPIVVLTLGYALFQTANNTAVMRGVSVDRRGVVSGLLNLARNLGLITGASVMGAVFASATGGPAIAEATPSAVGAGTRITFAVAATLMLVATAVAFAGKRKINGSPSKLWRAPERVSAGR